ncbi:MAG: hypothetical protein V1921_07520 [Candidatus Altiarchaeota archaeon]
MRWLILLVAAVLLASVFAEAFPQLPEYYESYVTVDGIYASNGTYVEVKVYGTNEVVGSAVTNEGGYYALTVNFDVVDGKGGIDEGANVGDQLGWYVNGVSADRPAPGSDTADPGRINHLFIVSVGETPLRIVDYAPSNSTQRLNKGENITFSVIAIGPSESKLKYNWTIDGIERSTNKSFTYGYSPEVVGTKVIKVQISDDSGDTVLKEWNLTTNTRPRISPPIPAISFNNSAVVTFDLIEYGKDNETPPGFLEWKVTGDRYHPPAFAHIGGLRKTLKIIPNLVYIGDGSLALTLTDAGGASVSQNISIDKSVFRGNTTVPQIFTTTTIHQITEKPRESIGGKIVISLLAFLVVLSIIFFITKSNQKAVILILILSFSIVLLYWNDYKTETKPVTVEFVSPKELNITKDYVQMCSNLFGRSEDIIEQFRLDDCYTSIAVLLRDSSICEEIKRIHLGYQYGCYGTNALFSRNPNICLNIESDTSIVDCLIDYADGLVDPSVCNVFKGDIVKKSMCNYRLKDESQLFYPKPEEYKCPTYKHIDCMPIVPRSHTKYCYGPYHEWLEENCDIYWTM